jgi:hypothetical protein
VKEEWGYKKLNWKLFAEERAQKYKYIVERTKIKKIDYILRKIICWMWKSYKKSQIGQYKDEIQK